VIGAGSLVLKNIGEYEIWGGNPVNYIKKRT
jgi:acetyltransferase-like isoleucine patch superfamily enzyme